MSLALIKQHLQTDGAHVGDILWWTLADARITRSQLEAIWSGAGLATGFLPEPPTPEKALKTAVRECQVGHRDHLVRLGKEDDRELVFAVLLETRDGAGNVQTQQEARIRLDRTAPTRLDCDHHGHDLVAAIAAAYDRLHDAHERRYPPRAREDAHLVRGRDTARLRRGVLRPCSLRGHAPPAPGRGRRDRRLAARHRPDPCQPRGSRGARRRRPRRRGGRSRGAPCRDRALPRGAAGSRFHADAPAPGLRGAPQQGAALPLGPVGAGAGSPRSASRSGPARW